MSKKEKKSFMIYNDWRQLFELLGNDEDRGRLVMALFAYEAGESSSCELEGALLMAYTFMTSQLERDREKWEKVSTARSEAAKKGGGAPLGNKNASKNKSENSNQTIQIKSSDNSNQTKQTKQTKQTDTDTVIDTDTDIDTDIDIDTDTETDTANDITFFNESESESDDLPREKKAMFGYAENIPLSMEEYETLCREFSKERTDAEIELMSGFCEEKDVSFGSCFGRLARILLEEKT